MQRRTRGYSLLMVLMLMGLLGVAVSFVLGIVMGGIAGYYGGKVDLVVQRLIEIVQSLPHIPLWLALGAIMPASWSPILVYFGITVILAMLKSNQMAVLSALVGEGAFPLESMPQPGPAEKVVTLRRSPARRDAPRPVRTSLVNRPVLSHAA